MSKYYKAFNAIKNLVKGGKQKTTGTGAIKSVKPNVPKTEYDKAFRDLKLAVHKAKGQKAKTDQTIFEFKNPKFKGEKFTFDSSKKKSGRVGRKFGSPKPKSNVQKIKETFKPNKKLSPKQMKIAKLAGDKKRIDAPDFAKLRGKK